MKVIKKPKKIAAFIFECKQCKAEVRFLPIELGNSVPTYGTTGTQITAQCPYCKAFNSANAVFDKERKKVKRGK